MPLLEKGKLYTLPNGSQVVLYPIAKLVSEMIQIGYPRDAQTIRKWEDSGVTPSAAIRSGYKRLYHKKHIEAYCKVAQECNIRQGVSINQTDFSERIWVELQAVNKELGL